MAAEERPWLWIIYILTVGLPVGLVVLFCWPKVARISWSLPTWIHLTGPTWLGCFHFQKPVDDYVYRRVEQPQSHIEEEEEEEEGGEADEEEKEAGAGEPAAGVTIICWCFNFAAVLSFTLITTAAFLFKAQDEGESQENNGQGDNQVGADNEEEEMEEEEEEEEESEENKTPERTLEDEVRVSCSVCLW